MLGTGIICRSPGSRKETPDIFIFWLRDNSILHIAPDHYSITAIFAGKIRLPVESNDGFTRDYCDVTVSGPESKDSVEKTSGREIINLSASDKSKIKAKSGFAASPGMVKAKPLPDLNGNQYMWDNLIDSGIKLAITLSGKSLL